MGCGGTTEVAAFTTRNPQARPTALISRGSAMSTHPTSPLTDWNSRRRVGVEKKPGLRGAQAGASPLTHISIRQGCAGGHRVRKGQMPKINAAGPLEFRNHPNRRASTGRAAGRHGDGPQVRSAPCLWSWLLSACRDQLHPCCEGRRSLAAPFFLLSPRAKSLLISVGKIIPT
jgi:hypothetical protein